MIPKFYLSCDWVIHMLRVPGKYESSLFALFGNSEAACRIVHIFARIASALWKIYIVKVSLMTIQNHNINNFFHTITISEDTPFRLFQGDN